MSAYKVAVLGDRESVMGFRALGLDVFPAEPETAAAVFDAAMSGEGQPYAIIYITEELIAGRNIELRNFGVFEIKVRKERKGRNPNKPQDVVRIPERAVVKFRAGKELKEAVEKLNTAKIK